MGSEYERILREGRREGEELNKINLASIAITKGKMSLEDIAENFDLPINTVIKLAEAKAG